MTAPEKKRRFGTVRSLNFALWSAFAMFACAVIVISAIVLGVLVENRFREDAAESLREAGSEALRAEEENGWLTQETVSSVAAGRSLEAYLLYPETRTVVVCAGEERTYEELEWAVQAVEGSEEPACIDRTEELAYAAAVASDGGACCLCFTVSLGAISSFGQGFRWATLFTVLFSVVLSFVASAIVSALIAKPIVEVSDRARELARGNYGTKISKNYFFTEIAELSESLDCARAEIARADHVQKELIANVSHDFKTPLTMIKAYASMIKDISGEDREKREAHAQVIIDEADRLASLVGDVLDLSKLRAGVGEEERAVFNLSETVYVIAERFSYLKSQGYRIETEIGEEIYCHGVRVRIEQVIYNLIGNAVNYTGEDRRVRVKLIPSGGGARLEVIDSGKGIPPEETDTIWDRYYRSSETHKRPVQGTGLGLSIVKEILLAHDVPFGVISEVGKGSCFWVEFPAPPAAEQGTEQKEELHE